VGKRSAAILDLIDGRGTVSYNDLAKSLDVSTMTVRRECEELFRTGKIIRTTGGIRRANEELGFYESATDERIYANSFEKRAIAKSALELIREPVTIFIDGSTTSLALAKLIDAGRKGMTVVTHSTMICLALRSGLNRVICAGGDFDPRSLCLVGPEVEQFVKSVFVDIAFVSATGFIPKIGTFESDPATFRVKQALAGQVSEVVLLVDHTKFGRRALSKVLDLSEINHVVTDVQVGKEHVKTLRDAGIKVSLAQP
jgi:DeoR family transcriptional regulator, aga operon transcriptional repressor